MLTVYKYVSLMLLVAVLGLGSGLLWQNGEASKKEFELQSKLAQFQQLVEEGKGLYFSQGMELNNLKAANKELQTVIEKKKQDVVAVTSVSLRWKDKYYEIKNATQSAVDSAGTQPSSLPDECSACFVDRRFKVDFFQIKDKLKISGFTLTNPAEAYVHLEWLEDLQLQLVLTKDDAGVYNIHLDTQNSDFIPTSLTLQIDPSVLQRRWYEKIFLFGQVNVGNALVGQSSWGGLASVGAGYLMTPKFGLGANVMILYNVKAQLYYGAYVSYYPWAR